MAQTAAGEISGRAYAGQGTSGVVEAGKFARPATIESDPAAGTIRSPMATLDYSSPDRPKSPVGPIALAVLLVMAIAFCAVAVSNNARRIHRGDRGSKDYPLWYETGQRVLHGGSAYYKDPKNHEYPFMYPPAAAALLAPATVAGKLPLVILQVVINTLAWAVAIFAPVYLLTGRVRPGDVRRDPAALLFWLPSLVCAFFIWDTYLEGQPAFLLSACLLVMFVCLRRRLSWGAGLSLALAAGFKGFPILALPYLIWRREWKATGYAVLFLALLTFALPAVFRGPRGAWSDAREWGRNMIFNQTPEIIGQRAARSYTWQNGSLLSVAHRWLRPVVADHDDNVPPITVNVADVPYETINRLVKVATVLAGLVYVAVMPWRDRDRTPFTDAAEAAMLLILVVLFSPLSFTYNQSWLMCGTATVLWFILTRARSRTQGIVAIVWLVVALSLLVFTVGGPFRAIRARGNTFFADVLLLVELGWIILVERSRPFEASGVDAVVD